MLCAVAENETITTEDTDRNRELGRRRAMQGLPLSDVIETYHIASRELWDTMVQRSTKPTHELLQAGGKLWDLVHAATSAVAVGHSEATRSEQAIRAGVRYRFFETLHSATDIGTEQRPESWHKPSDSIHRNRSKHCRPSRTNGQKHKWNTCNEPWIPCMLSRIAVDMAPE